MILRPRRRIIAASQPQRPEFGRSAPPEPYDFPPVQAGHFRVDDEKVDAMVGATQDTGRLVPAGDLDHFESFVDQRPGDHRAASRIVVHDEDPRSGGLAIVRHLVKRKPRCDARGPRPLADCLTWPQAASNRHEIQLSSPSLYKTVFPRDTLPSESGLVSCRSLPSPGPMPRPRASTPSSPSVARPGNGSRFRRLPWGES
jgi:hypothetical protein